MSGTRFINSGDYNNIGIYDRYKIYKLITRKLLNGKTTL